MLEIVVLKKGLETSAIQHACGCSYFNAAGLHALLIVLSPQNNAVKFAAELYCHTSPLKSTSLDVKKRCLYEITARVVFVHQYIHMLIIV